MEISHSTQLEDASYLLDISADLIIPRCRNKGKERAFDDQRIQKPYPFAAESRHSELSGKNFGRLILLFGESG